MNLRGSCTLTLRGLQRWFGETRAVDDLSFEVRPGSVYGLLGPNGAGKTTTLRMAVGILMPDAGEVTIGGEPLGPQTRRRIGYLPEERGVYGRMKVGEQVAFFAHLRGLPGRERDRATARWIERMGLAGVTDRRADELSHGTQQLLQITLALVHDPEVVVLDEPFTGLDPHRVRMVGELIGALRDEGKAVVVSTHAMEQAEELCDRVGLINQGRLCSEGDPRELRRVHGTVRLRVVYEDGPPEGLRLPPWATVRMEGAVVHASWPAKEPPHEVLSALVSHGPPRELELQPPGLRDVFFSIVR